MANEKRSFLDNLLIVVTIGVPIYVLYQFLKTDSELYQETMPGTADKQKVINELYNTIAAAKADNQCSDTAIPVRIVDDVDIPFPPGMLSDFNRVSSQNNPANWATFD